MWLWAIRIWFYLKMLLNLASDKLPSPRDRRPNSRASPPHVLRNRIATIPSPIPEWGINYSFLTARISMQWFKCVTRRKGVPWNVILKIYVISATDSICIESWTQIRFPFSSKRDDLISIVNIQFHIYISGIIRWRTLKLMIIIYKKKLNWIFRR